MRIQHGFMVIAAAAMMQSCGSEESATSQPSSQDNLQQPEMSQYDENTIPITDCVAPSTWFQLNGAGDRDTPKPAEGPNSAFANNGTVSNCDFHKWSWQKFLWLTKPVNGKPLFLTELHQVTPTGDSVSTSQGLQLKSIAQASSATDVLVSNAAYSANGVNDTVYYSIHMNNTMFQTMNTYAPIAATDSSAVKDVSFPIGALELKVSWIPTQALADTNGYFITEAKIHGYPVRVAMLGMHVVGRVINHPEFVWATFEHTDLAPKYDWAAATPTSDAVVSATKNYLFFNKDTTATVTNIRSGNHFYQNIFSLYPYGVPFEKAMKGKHNVQLYMATSQVGYQNYGNIKTINESVANQLSGVWANYFYNGSIWINTADYNQGVAQAHLMDSLGYSISNSSPGDLTRGSVACYNVTMETYVQAGFDSLPIYEQKSTDLANCFSCHSAPDGKISVSPLNFSHVFKGKVKSLRGMSAKEIKAAHVAEIWKAVEIRAAARKDN